MKRLILLLIASAYLQSMGQQKQISSGVFHWADAPVNKSADREGRQFMEGQTPYFDYLEIHATTQYKGAAPKPPHAQTDIEELLYIKEGTMKFTMGTDSKILPAGSIILIPPHEDQALQNIGNGPLTYYVIMFRSKKPMDMGRSAKAGGPLMLNFDSLKYVPSAKGGGIKYLNRPTAMLANLEIHLTELKAKGPAHVPHTHEDAELTIMLEGETEMIIKDKTYTAKAGDIYLMNGNDLHGISNSKDVPCKYLAIRMR